ncbi:hypothetical protein B0T21DRAFT_355521 [Apiosordaria backusii]|uniref:Uncharacterized protein n=1 Tax=Apiosordaria backusii TaxID=314023 RepID=A0AA40EYM4_9PEZI|nr:hypothetical protein B0T21DRAFT_355521 [Apiosordaria backusii]
MIDNFTRHPYCLHIVNLTLCQTQLQHTSLSLDKMNTETECSKWTDSQIVTYVMSQIPGGLGMTLTIDSNELDHIAAVIDYDGPEGLLTINGDFVVTGSRKRKSGVYLYISEKVYVMGEFPRVRWVHKVK